MTGGHDQPEPTGDSVRVWAKLMMIFQSMVSLALAALVIARAINIL